MFLRLVGVALPDVPGCSPVYLAVCECLWPVPGRIRRFLCFGSSQRCQMDRCLCPGVIQGVAFIGSFGECGRGLGLLICDLGDVIQDDGEYLRGFFAEVGFFGEIVVLFIL